MTHPRRFVLVTPNYARRRRILLALWRRGYVACQLRAIFRLPQKAVARILAMAGRPSLWMAAQQDLFAQGAA